MKGEVLNDAALLMHAEDSVATALADLAADRSVTLPKGGTVTVEGDVPFGHKFALEPIAAGDDVCKYGEVIGTATARIDAGEWVHTHNCESGRGRGDLAVEKEEA